MNRVFPIQLVVDQLAAVTTAFVETGGAAGYARAVEEARRFPVAFAVPTRDNAGPNSYGVCVGQRVEAQFAVAMLARDIRADGGLETTTELETCRADVHAALVGWEPGEGFEIVTYVGGLILSDIGEDGLLVWQATYTTAFQLEDTR